MGLANYKVEPTKVTVPLRLALRNGLEKGTLKNAKVSGKGSGSYRVAPVVKEDKGIKLKKPVAKTADAVAKKAKKPAGKFQKDTAVTKSSEKEAKGKKPTAKKSSNADKTLGKTVTKAASVKKTVAKKSDAKVSADKQTAAKKAAPKKAA